MKFKDYLLAPGVRPLSIGLGCLIGGATALFTDWTWGAFVGAIAVLVAALAIPLIVFLQEMPYNRLKKSLPQPFLLDQRVQFTAKGGNVSGYFILTDDRMIFLSMEKGEHQMELSRNEVKSIRSDERFCIHIYLSEKEFVRIQTPVSEEILKVLTEKGWG